MLGFGKPADPPAPPPDPAGTIRIGGIKVTVAESKPGEMVVTLHDFRRLHYGLSVVLEKHLRKKGYDIGAHLQHVAPAGGGTYADFPSTLLLYAHTPDTAPALTVDAVTAECKELADQITDAIKLGEAFGQAKLRAQGGGAQVG